MIQRASMFLLLAFVSIPTGAIRAQIQIYDLVVGANQTLYVAGLGDINNDGYGDMAAVGSATGLVVFSGRDGSVRFAMPLTSFNNYIDAIAGIGDADSDGCGDIAVGHTYGTPPGGGSLAGAVTVLSGRTGTILWRVFGSPGVGLGSDVSKVGDVDGDGRADVLAASLWGGPNVSGSAVLLSGANGAQLFSGLPGPPWVGAPAHVAGPGDMNGDGVPDILVSSGPIPAALNGFVRGFSGLDGSLLFSVSGQPPITVFGGAVGAGGDIDGDGRGDFLVAGGNVPGGRLFAYSGANAQVILSVTGPTPTSNYGWMPTMLNDINGDGRSEFTTNACSYLSPSSCAFPVFSGLDGSILVNVPYSIGGTAPAFGVVSAGRGDIYPDGAMDLLLGTAETPVPPSTFPQARMRVISLVPLPAATASPVGTGCGGIVPMLGMQPPRLGGLPWLAVWNGPPLGQGHLFLSANGGQSFPAGGGCTAYLDWATMFEALTFTMDAAGFWAVQLPLSRELNYVGFSGRMQAAIVPAAGGLQLTNALDFMLGF